MGLLFNPSTWTTVTPAPEAVVLIRQALDLQVYEAKMNNRN